jgi:hypothetical protein
MLEYTTNLLIPRQLSTSPMCVFAIWVELTHDMPVQSLHYGAAQMFGRIGSDHQPKPAAVWSVFWPCGIIQRSSVHPGTGSPLVAVTRWPGRKWPLDRLERSTLNVVQPLQPLGNDVAKIL